MGTQDRFTALQVIAVRYRGVTPDTSDERGLDTFAASAVYASAGLPVEVCEPQFPTQLASGVKADDYGLFNGIIADHVAEACRANKAVMMTGGDCSHLTGVIGGLQQVMARRRASDWCSLTRMAITTRRTPPSPVA